MSKVQETQSSWRGMQNREMEEKAREKKKASVNVVNTVGTAPPAAPAAPAVVAAAPAAGVISVQVVPQPAYTFNPERFSETTDGDGGVTDFWKLSIMIPI